MVLPIKFGYINADSLELLINGVSQGQKPMQALGRVSWDVNYSPGSVQVKAYRGGSVIATETIETTGEPAGIKLEVEVGQQISADKQDVALIKGSIIDAQGRVVPTAGNFVTFSATGPGSVVGVGNGDPSCHEPDRASSRSAFNGLVRAVVQATDQPGTITITASSPGLKSDSTTVTSTKPSVPIPSI